METYKTHQAVTFKCQTVFFVFEDTQDTYYHKNPSWVFGLQYFLFITYFVCEEKGNKLSFIISKIVNLFLYLVDDRP